MRQNVIQLEKFYASRLGQTAVNMATRRLASLWPDLSGKEVLGYGYVFPFIPTYLANSRRIIMAMPGEQGAMAQEAKRGNITCLVQEDSLPFSDAQFDNIIVVHGLEESNSLQSLLAELWRVTKPEGRVVIIASNRAGLWARSDKSPFGAGRPFSRAQLKGLLLAAGYEPIFWSGALYSPPIRRLTHPGLSSACERFGETVCPRLSGLVLVEAVKRLYVEPNRAHGHRVTRPVFGARPIGNSASRK
jgi:SAM-dependent methyltransferase